MNTLKIQILLKIECLGFYFASLSKRILYKISKRYLCIVTQIPFAERVSNVLYADEKLNPTDTGQA